MCEKHDVIGTHGETVICSISSSEKKDITVDPINKVIEKIFQKSTFFKKRYKCGHSMKGIYTVSIYGMEVKLTKELCPDCLVEYAKQHAIYCCLCGNPILPHDPVALYGGGMKIRKDIATQIDGGAFVGCMRWDCGIGGFFSGHWTEDGFRSYWDKDEE